MPAATDILSLAPSKLWAATTSTLVANVDGQPYFVALTVCHHWVLEECMKACSRTRGEVEWGGQIVSALERQSLVVTNNDTARFKIAERSTYLMK